MQGSSRAASQRVRRQLSAHTCRRRIPALLQPHAAHDALHCNKQPWWGGTGEAASIQVISCTAHACAAVLLAATLARCSARHARPRICRRSLRRRTCRCCVALALDVGYGAPLLLQAVQGSGHVKEAGAVTVHSQFLRVSTAAGGKEEWYEIRASGL